MIWLFQPHSFHNLAVSAILRVAFLTLRRFSASCGFFAATLRIPQSCCIDIFLNKFSPLFGCFLPHISSSLCLSGLLGRIFSLVSFLSQTQRGVFDLVTDSANDLVYRFPA